MKRVFVKSLDEDGPLSRGAAVTLGVFDGMHQGHLKVLDLTCETGRRLGADTVVVTFAQHPEKLLNRCPPRMILTLEHRLRLMERSGIDLAVVIPFDERVRNVPARTFLTRFLMDRLAMRSIILGHDTAFGKGREGDAGFLENLHESLGFEVQRTPEVRYNGTVISSTRIREAILAGELNRVEEMLGRELSFMGRVVAGDGRGRKIGFPTANIDCGEAPLPPAGVYEVKVLTGGVTRRGVMNIGTRPTFYPGQKGVITTVEVHLPGFNGDLYDQDLEVFIARRIRGEKRFNSVDELIAAIERDIASLGR